MAYQRVLIVAITFYLIASCSGCLYARVGSNLAARAEEEEPHWSYNETTPDGPSHWGHLAEEYAECDEGLKQSPISFSPSSKSDVKSYPMGKYI